MHTNWHTLRLHPAPLSSSGPCILLWLLLTGWPLLLRRVRRTLHIYGQRLIQRISKPFTSDRRSSPYSKYRDIHEEARYWRSARRLQRHLGNSNSLALSTIPVVLYYTPPLPPPSHGTATKDPETTESPLSPKSFCKWHRMVFKGPLHPTLKQAKSQIKNYSSRDRRMIYRISRMLSDEEVFGSCGRRTRWSPEYQEMWRVWLERKGPDVAIVFR
ncbi:hypothetical protein OE88DRAFT_1213597 [Heliocybe sulcata]|uniref:Uncharacterized protein n=1 Tax=Heliocybe sulcata TaxID=5364 RepID=A0A5C3MJN5_9AGAM|nr:hypothetical protein OE88DRAFT_1213597 [Heliocybe sulcata]